jgi:hypothetical protein
MVALASCSYDRSKGGGTVTGIPLIRTMTSSRHRSRMSPDTSSYASPPIRVTPDYDRRHTRNDHSWLIINTHRALSDLLHSYVADDPPPRMNGLTASYGGLSVPSPCRYRSVATSRDPSGSLASLTTTPLLATEYPRPKGVTITPYGTS